MLGSRRSKMSMLKVENKQRQKKMVQLPLHYEPSIEKNLTTSTTMDTYYTDDSYYNSYDEEADYDDYSWQTSSSSLLQVASMIKRGHTDYNQDESMNTSKDTVSKKKYNISNSNRSSSRQRRYETIDNTCHEKISLPSTVLKYMNKTENVVQKEDGPTKSILKDSPPRSMKTSDNMKKKCSQKEDKPVISISTQSARQKRRIKAQAHVELKQQLERVAIAKQKTKKETRRQRKVKDFQRMRKEYNEKKVLMKERQEFECKRKEQLSTYLSKEEEEKDSKEDESKEVDTSEDDIQAVTSQDTNGAPSGSSTGHNRTFLDFVQHLIVEKSVMNEGSVVSSLGSSSGAKDTTSSVKNALPSPEDICKELHEVEEKKKNLQEPATTLDDIEIDMEASNPIGILPFDEHEASVSVGSNDNGYIQLLSDAAASRHRAKMVLRARELIKSRKDEIAESDNDHTPSEVDF